MRVRTGEQEIEVKAHDAETAVRRLKEHWRPAPTKASGPAMRPKLVIGAVVVLLLDTIGLVLIRHGDKSDPVTGPTPANWSARTTRPADTGSPGEVVDSYLRNRLVDGDVAAAKALQCRAPSLTVVDSYVDDMTNREKAYHLTIDWAWTIRQTSVASTDRATVTLDLIKTAGDGASRSSEYWAFGVADEDGWKVCSARRTGS